MKLSAQDAAGVATPSREGAKRSAAPTFALRFGARMVALAEGETLVGRGVTCHVVLDGPLISRLHARITVSGGRVSISDAGSRNGVLVNGRRIVHSALLSVGDTLVLGDMHLELVERPPTRSREHITENDLRVSPEAQEAARRAKLEPFPHDPLDESTRTAHVFELLGSVVDKALAMGRPQEAAKLLAPHLDRILDELRAGREVPATVSDAAASYIIKLADATLDGRWLDIVVEIFRAQRRPLPLPVVDRLYTLFRRLRGGDRARFRDYVHGLQLRAEHLSAAERFALKRLEGLARLAAL